MDLSELKQNWEILAQRDPMWAIVSVPDMKGRKWDPVAFFESGRAGIEDILNQIAAAKFPLRRGTALDFGCGLGRLTQAIAGHFEETFGVDISPTMIAEAARLNRFGDSCTYVQNDCPDLRRFADATFDFIYSDAVLQHIPPDASKAYIAEFVRVLKPGGLLMFQVPSTVRPVPTRINGVFVRIRDLFLRAGRSKRRATAIGGAANHNQEKDSNPSDGLEQLIDMYGIPREQVCELLEQRNATILNIQEENWSGPEWYNFRYWVTKQG